MYVEFALHRAAAHCGRIRGVVDRRGIVSVRQLRKVDRQHMGARFAKVNMNIWRGNARANDEAVQAAVGINRRIARRPCWRGMGNIGVDEARIYCRRSCAQLA